MFILLQNIPSSSQYIEHIRVYNKPKEGSGADTTFTVHNNAFQ